MTTKTKLDQSASWDIVTNDSEGFSPLDAPMTLTGQTLSPAVSPGLTYYVRFTTTHGGTGPLDGSTLYQLNSFSFDEQQTVSIGSQSSGAGAGKVTFNPLDLVLTQPALTPALFEMLASGATFQEVDVLGYGADGTLATDDSFGFVAASELSSSSSGTTTVALQYGSASFISTPPSNGTPISGSWDRVTNTNDFSTDGETDPPPLAAPATLSDAPALSPAVSPGLTYYVRFTTTHGGTGPLDGSTLYQLNSFSFDEQQTVSIGSQSGGAGAGKVTFNPLDLVLTQPALTPALFEMLASGATFQEVDVLGYGADGTLATDDSFGFVAASELSSSSSGTTTVALQYGSASFISTPPSNGTPISGSWDRVTNTNDFSTDGETDPPPLAAPATLSDAPALSPAVSPGLTYYVRFTTTHGGTGPLDGSTLYQLNSFSFDEQQTVSIGSQSSGAGAGKVTFNPLDLVLTQPALTPALFEMLASGATFQEVDVLGYGADGTLATDDSFGFVAASELSSSSSGTTTVALQYGSASFISTPPSNGTPISGSWDRVTNTNDFSTDGETDPPPLAAPATLSDAPALSPAVSPGLTYYVRFTTTHGGTGPLDGSTLYQLNSFSFDEQQTVSIGSQSGGAGAGKVTFNPLDLVLTQPALTPALFEMLASGATFQEVDVLGYGAGGTLATDDSFGFVAASELSSSSSGTTTVALQYGSASFISTPPGNGTPISGSWDRVTNTNDFSTDGETDPPPLAAPATLSDAPALSPAVSPGLTYYVRFTTTHGGTGPLDGSTLYQLNSFSFDEQQTVSIGSQSGGAGAGKVTFNPLDLVLTQPALTPALFEMLASGATFQEVDVLGYGAGGALATDDSFGFVAASELSSGSSGTTTVALQYGSASFISTPPGNGTPISGSWDRVTNTNDFSTDGETDPPPLAAPATLSDAPALSPAVSPGLTYYVRFTTTHGGTGPLDGSTLYQLNSFSFDEQQTVSIGSQSGGAGAGKVTFNPLDLVLTQPALTPALFEMLASGATFQEVDVLGYGADGTLATDDSFGLVGASDLSSGANGDTDISLRYASVSIQTYGTLNLGTFAAVSPAVVEQGQTTIVGTVTLGFAGETLTLLQTAGSGTLSLGAVAGGVQQVIYTAPSSIAASAVDAVSYTISDQDNDAVATASASVQLDAGPAARNASIIVGHNQALNETALVDGLVTPGLAGDTETITKVTGNATLSGQSITYQSPSAGPDSFSYTVQDQLGGTATGTVSVTVDPGPAIKPVTPAVLEKNQTTVIGTVTPGLAGDTLTLKQTGGTGTLSLVTVGGVREVIYTAPSVATSTQDTASYTITDQQNDAATGSSTILVAPTTDTIYVGTAGGTINVGNGNSAIDGRAGNETINVGNGTDVVLAGANDTINLGNGQDTVIGGSNDTIRAGNGTDNISTGANSHVTVGNNPDTVSVGDNSAVVVGNGQDTVTAGANATITGGNGQDTVTAGANAKITLGNGNNTVTPGANSTVTLGNGNNTVFGGANDVVSVGNGQNRLVAAPGDVWTVGNGQDVFTLNASFGNNTITDFNTSRDVLQFNHALFANYAAVMANTKQVGANTLITYDANDTVKLDAVTASHLTASSFKFT